MLILRGVLRSFPALSCEFATVDVSDSIGTVRPGAGPAGHTGHAALRCALDTCRGILHGTAKPVRGEGVEAI